LVAVVRPQNQGYVLQRNDEYESSEKKPDSADDAWLIQDKAMLLDKDFFQRVEGTGADVPIHNTNGGQHKSRYAAFMGVRSQSHAPFIVP
jgi:hypothetical protein